MNCAEGKTLPFDSYSYYLLMMLMFIRITLPDSEPQQLSARRYEVKLERKKKVKK